MEKTKVTTIEVEKIEHSFYCDECGEYLGTSEEYEDGYYDEYGNLQLSLNLYGWYTVKKCLCDNCRTKFINKCIESLQSLSFIKD